MSSYKKDQKHNKEWEKAVHEIALRYGMTDSEMKVITDAPFKFVKHIAFKELKNVRFQHLGLFAVFQKKRYRKYGEIKKHNGGLLELVDRESRGQGDGNREA